MVSYGLLAYTGTRAEINEIAIIAANKPYPVGSNPSRVRTKAHGEEIVPYTREIPTVPGKLLVR